MKDGRTFNWDDQEMKEHPYEGRDPRFYLTIVHEGMKWPAKKPVEIFEGGANGQPLLNATVTGYYLRKYVNNSISFEPGAPTAKSNHNWILFRYADVLLSYAEAMVNAYDNMEYTSDKCKMTALEAINLVRSRAEMPPLSQSLSKEDFLERVRHERRVELAFEGHRFWDLRRWKRLEESSQIYAVSIIKNNDQLEFHKFILETRPINDKYYFYPFANTELFKNKNFKQNPGWN